MKLGAYLSMSDKLQGEYKQTFDFAEGYCDSHMIRGILGKHILPTKIRR